MIGLFKVIESFAIKRKNEFYLIGKLESGTIAEQFYINVPINNSLSISLKIDEIEEIEITNEKESYTLLIIREFEDVEEIDLLLMLNIGNEFMPIIIDEKE